jgi:hypothetical protein
METIGIRQRNWSMGRYQFGGSVIDIASIWFDFCQKWGNNWLQEINSQQYWIESGKWRNRKSKTRRITYRSSRISQSLSQIPSLFWKDISTHIWFLSSKSHWIVVPLTFRGEFSRQHRSEHDALWAVSCAWCEGELSKPYPERRRDQMTETENELLP